MKNGHKRQGYGSSIYNTNKVYDLGPNNRPQSDQASFKLP
jgi:hypothetical protein